MALFKCEKCGFQKRVPDHFSGKRTRCPKCHQPGRIAADEVGGISQEPMVAFRCSKCGQTLKAHPERTGKNVRCPACNNLSSLPTGRQVAPDRSPVQKHMAASAGEKHSPGIDADGNSPETRQSVAGPRPSKGPRKTVKWIMALAVACAGVVVGTLVGKSLFLQSGKGNLDHTRPLDMAPHDPNPPGAANITETATGPPATQARSAAVRSQFIARRESLRRVVSANPGRWVDMSWSVPEISKNLYDPSYDSEALAQKLGPLVPNRGKDWVLVQENGQFRKGRKIYQTGEDGVARVLDGDVRGFWLNGRRTTGFVKHGLCRLPRDACNLYTVAYGVGTQIEGARFFPEIETMNGDVRELFVYLDPEDRAKGYCADGNKRYLVELRREASLPTGGKLIDMGARADRDGNVFFIDPAATQRFGEGDIEGLFGLYGAYGISGQKYNDVCGVMKTEYGYVLVRRLKTGRYVHTRYDSDQGIITREADREVILVPKRRPRGR